MGISKATFRLLLEEKKRGLLEGSLLQLGRQHTFLTYPELHSLASLHHTSISHLKF